MINSAQIEQSHNEISRKKLLAILTIALAAQTIAFNKPAKANEDVDLQNAKSKLDEGNYSEALKIYNILLQKGTKQQKFIMDEVDHYKNSGIMSNLSQATPS